MKELFSSKHLQLVLVQIFAIMASCFDPDSEMSDIFTKLWELDTNKCHPGEDYEIDLQGYVTNTRRVGQDRARDTLFVWVDEDKIFERETFKAFKALLDNYETELGKAEKVTPDEWQENWDFLDSIMKTDVMTEAHSYLISKGAAPEDLEKFKELLCDVWFKLIRRTKGDRDFDSSSFEHVFVGESRGKEIVGLHNWLQFYLQEKLGTIDYHGYFRRETLRDDEVPRIMSLQFGWKEGNEEEKSKPMSSMFLGTSPEFEIAVYTICRLLNKAPKFDIQLAEYEAQVVVYKLGQGIGTAYIGGARL